MSIHRSLAAGIMIAALSAGCKDNSASEDEGPCAEAGNICLFSGVYGQAALGAEGGLADETYLYLPQDLSFSPCDDQPYILDWNNHRVRTVDEDGLSWTVAGNGLLGDGPEGPAMNAAFNHPTNIAFNSKCDLVIAAWHNSRIEKVDLATGELTFLAGDGNRSYAGDGGPAVDAILDLPSSVAYDDQDRLFISDQANQIIRMIDTDGTITTVAGVQGEPGFSGDGGPALEAQIHSSVGQAADPSSRLTYYDGRIWFVDSDNNRVRYLEPSASNPDEWIINTFAGSGELGSGGDGGPALEAQFNLPRDLAWSPDGSLYIADTDNSCVRVIDPDGVVDTFAGVCGEAGAEGDEGPATSALLHRPYGVAVDPHGDVYISDTYNQVIRVVRAE